MKLIVDLHIHSRYSRACSKDLTPGNLATWANKKGIDVLSTGDFTHPAWFAELKENLTEAGQGVFTIKNNNSKTLFILGTELASIYKQGDKVRRVHNLVFAPSFHSAEKFIEALEKRGVNLKADGRPIMGVSCSELLKICKEVDSGMQLIPAHAWTPNFGVFGSLSGFDNLVEAYGELKSEIKAIETGLSSDPKMNWQIPALQNIALISNSDAHSLRKLGREANVLKLKQITYNSMFEAIYSLDKTKFLHTIEFFPEEGKYHNDGHADCKFSCQPTQTKKLSGVCPVCGKKLLRGVLSRIDDLANIKSSDTFKIEHSKFIPYKSIIPLEEIIADVFGVGVTSKKVLAMYEQMVVQATEFEILLNLDKDSLIKISDQYIAESIMRVREGKVILTLGYDGVFGKIQVYGSEEREKFSLKPKQGSLF